MKGKITRAVLLLTLCVMLVPNAFAEGWKHLGSDKEDTHYFYKPKTYHLKNNVASAWTKKELKVDANAMAQRHVQPDDYTGKKSIVLFEEFNCVEKKKRTIIGKVYEGVDDTDVRKSHWEAIQAGSIDEGLFAVLCKEAGNGGKAPGTK